MTALSVGSLRRIHPEVRTTLIADEPSARAVERSPHGFINGLQAEMCVCKAPPGLTPVTHSRFLKTNLRNQLEGPFLYLDSDTLVVQPITPVFAATQFSASLDRHWRAPSPGFPHWVLPLYRSARWSTSRRYPYFNSGVTFWPETREARVLGERWHSYWHESLRLGQYRDQPALNAAVRSVPFSWFNRLPCSYNAMIDADPRLARSAHIVHFFSSPKAKKRRSILDQMVEETLAGKEVGAYWIETLLETQWPYLTPPSSDSRLRASYFRRCLRQRAIAGGFFLKENMRAAVARMLRPRSSD
ncbi:MAG TPA: hypothetical protein PLN52_17840 [Opitutaceae bacterium]|nr:hypothetical protein [Opitutaceae bacterium]